MQHANEYALSLWLACLVDNDVDDNEFTDNKIYYNDNKITDKITEDEINDDRITDKITKDKITKDEINKDEIVDDNNNKTSSVPDDNDTDSFIDALINDISILFISLEL